MMLWVSTCCLPAMAGKPYLTYTGGPVKVSGDTAFEGS